MIFKTLEEPLTESIRQMDEAHQAIAMGMGRDCFKEWVDQTPKNNLNGCGAKNLGGNRWHKSFDLEGSRYFYFFDYYSPKAGTCKLERIEVKEIPQVDPLKQRVKVAFSTQTSSSR